MKPIFIFGCPRSGTTLLLRILASHGELAWVSKHQNKLARRGISLGPLALANRIYDVPSLGRCLLCHWDKKWVRGLVPTPDEPWFFWETHLQNFRWQRSGSSPPRRRTAEDATQREIAQARAAVRQVMRWQSKPRFISKYTDFPRLKYLKRVFPDAQFIHIVREGRAVVNSYYAKLVKGTFQSWVDEAERAWWISGWPKAWREEWAKEWKHHPEASLAFTVFKWKFLKRQIDEEIDETGVADCIRVDYADLIAQPTLEVERLLDFCELALDGRVRSYLQCTRLENRNDKWEERLSSTQKEVLKDILGRSALRS